MVHTVVATKIVVRTRVMSLFKTCRHQNTIRLDMILNCLGRRHRKEKDSRVTDPRRHFSIIHSTQISTQIEKRLTCSIRTLFPACISIYLSIYLYKTQNQVPRGVLLYILRRRRKMQCKIILLLRRGLFSCSTGRDPPKPLNVSIAAKITRVLGD